MHDNLMVVKWHQLKTLAFPTEGELCDFYLLHGLFLPVHLYMQMLIGQVC